MFKISLLFNITFAMLQRVGGVVKKAKKSLSHATAIKEMAYVFLLTKTLK